MIIQYYTLEKVANFMVSFAIIWQYPNGTHAYSGLGLPSKWVHPENAVNAEPSLRRVS